MKNRYIFNDHIGEDTDNRDALDWCLKNFEYLLEKISAEKPSEKVEAKTNLKSKEVTNLFTFRHIKDTAAPTVIHSYKWDIHGIFTPKESNVSWQWRQMKSLNKFVDMMESLIFHIFDFEVAEKLVTSFSEKIPDSYELKKKAWLESNCKPIVTDGFIMEGKTEWFSKRGMRDSEADLFWRNKMSNGEVMPQKYFWMFQVYSYYKSFLTAVSNKAKWFSISRLFSHALFNHRGCDLWNDHLMFSRYVNFIGTLILIFTHSTRVKVEVLYFKNKEMPWPINEKRESFEGAIYKKYEDLQKEALQFYCNLDTCFAEYSMAESHYTGAKTLAEMLECKKKRKFSELESE